MKHSKARTAAQHGKNEQAQQQEEIEMAPMQQNLVLLQEREQLNDKISETRAALELANQANAELFNRMRDGKKQFFHNPLARGAEKQKGRRKSVAVRKNFAPVMVQGPQLDNSNSEIQNPIMEAMSKRKKAKTKTQSMG